MSGLTEAEMAEALAWAKSEPASLVARALLQVEADRTYLKRREESIIEACQRVADGGQYRADIVSAIQRIRGERDGLAPILDEVMAERARQDQQWGGPEHDDEHTGLDWLSYILGHAGKMLSGALRFEHGRNPAGSVDHDRAWTFTITVPPVDERNPSAYRKQLVRVAALAWAALQADRRHASTSP